MSKFPLCVYIGLGYGDGLGHWLNSNYVDKVIGFEPVKKHFDIICDALQNNKRKNDVYLFNSAASNINATQKFYITDNGVSSSLYKPTNCHIEREVQCVNLLETLTNTNWKDFLGKNDIEYIDLLIIDSQGHDFTILKNIEPLLQEKRIGRIQVEIIDDNSYEDSNNNFSLYENYKPLLENYNFQTKVNGENPDQYDAVFVLKEEKNQINQRFYFEMVG